MHMRMHFYVCRYTCIHTDVLQCTYMYIYVYVYTGVFRLSGFVIVGPGALAAVLQAETRSDSLLRTIYSYVIYMYIYIYISEFTYMHICSGHCGNASAILFWLERLSKYLRGNLSDCSLTMSQTQNLLEVVGTSLLKYLSLLGNVSRRLKGPMLNFLAKHEFRWASPSAFPATHSDHLLNFCLSSYVPDSQSLHQAQNPSLLEDVKGDAGIHLTPFLFGLAVLECRIRKEDSTLHLTTSTFAYLNLHFSSKNKNPTPSTVSTQNHISLEAGPHLHGQFHYSSKFGHR